MTSDRPTPPRAIRDTHSYTPSDAEALRAGIDARAAAEAAVSWVLESRFGAERSLQRTPVHPLPFRIGRTAGVGLVLPSSVVSKVHAEIYADGPGLRIRDLGSRNGTLLNRARVADAPLQEGDVLHIGDYEFRVARDLPEKGNEGTVVMTAPLSRHFLAGAARVPELIEKAAVTMLFQPIVALPSESPVAYEALGRGRLEGLPESPVELFDLAGGQGPETQAELSRLFRLKAVQLVRDLPQPPLLFLNTHPVELERPGLVESLEQLRALVPQVDLVLEIHESALAQTEAMSRLRTRLMEINVALAYDDFGVGQARLFELAEAPPHYLKFDRRFITGLDRAPTSRQRLVASLVAAARELQVKTVAEGVETPLEAAACLRAGFTHAQGYHFGRPGVVETIR